MSTVLFDAEAHTYTTLDGRRLPSVTAIIKGAGLMDEAWWNTYARDRGSMAHQAVALIHEDALDRETLDPVLAPYVAAWDGFARASAATAILWEQRVADAERGYAGTLDVVLEMAGDPAPWVVDLKTGPPQPWAALQTAAYARAVKPILLAPRLKRAALALAGDGTWKLTEHTDRQDEKVFLAALEVYTWKQSHS